MQTTPETSFERFILKMRPLCEVQMCARPSVHVLSPFKNPKAVCEHHWQPDAPMPDPWTDEEFTELAMQEPLPPNQSPQLPAEEFPSGDNQNETEPYTIHT